jgi:hypothetical protein
LPIDPISNSGKWELSLEMGARRDLKMVVISTVIMAGNNLSVDGINVSIPSALVLSNEVVIIEISFIRASIGVSIGLEGIVEFIDSNVVIGVEVLHSLVGALIKAIEIIVKVRYLEVNLAQNLALNDSNG